MMARTHRTTSAFARPFRLRGVDRVLPAEEGAAMSRVRQLVRHDERFRFEQLDGVYFSMADAGTHVLCKVSHEALRDRSARDGERASLFDTFVRHRARIETIAGEKYAQGHRPNDLVLVLSRDLAPLPM